ncbi:hypothetical protein [Kitasatospora sp. P5_F3]
MQPTIGRIVHYTLTDQDAAAINKRRDDFRAHQRTIAKAADPGQPGATGHMAHVGNHAEAGQTFPAMIARIWDTNPAPGCNLQVVLDGTDTYWATSRHEGTEPGNWAWPPRI